jgi:hypothetical protein
MQGLGVSAYLPARDLLLQHVLGVPYDSHCCRGSRCWDLPAAQCHTGRSRSAPGIFGKVLYSVVFTCYFMVLRTLKCWVTLQPQAMLQAVLCHMACISHWKDLDKGWPIMACTAVHCRQLLANIVPNKILPQGWTVVAEVLSLVSLMSHMQVDAWVQPAGYNALAVAYRTVLLCRNALAVAYCAVILCRHVPHTVR